MKLLLDSRGMVLSINENIVAKIEDGFKIWDTGNVYMSDNGYSCVEAENISLDIIPQKYFYIDGEFILNPNWINTPDEISKLQAENAALKSELSLLQEVVNEMLLGV